MPEGILLKMSTPDYRDGRNGHSNGHSNGYSNGEKNGYTNGKVKSSRPVPKPEYAGGPQKKPKEGALANFKKLRQASKRPLPTEMGDGSYRPVVARPTLKQDLRRLRMSGKSR